MKRIWLLLIVCANSANPVDAMVVHLSFDAPIAGTIADKFGNGTGFTHRLSGTGSAIAFNDPNLDLSATAGHLAIQSTRSDFNHETNLSVAEAPGILMHGVGIQDFVAEALFRQVVLPSGSDQSHVYIGVANNRSYRAGPHAGNTYSASKNNGGLDTNLFADLNQFAAGDDLLIRVTRSAGNWQLSWDNLTNPAASGALPSEAIPWLNSETDLYFGVNIADPGQSIPFLSRIDYFRVLVEPVAHNWNIDSNGNWSAAGNWIGGIPNGTSDRAVFGSIITAPRVVTVNTPITVARVEFDNLNAYNIGGSNPLTLETAGGVAEIMVHIGSHTIGAPLTLANDTVITISPATSNLSITAMATSGVDLTKAGAGTLTVNNVRAAGLTVNEGTVRVSSNGTDAGTSMVGALSIAGGATPTAKLDLGNNAAVVDYTGTSPVATVRQQIRAARGASGFGATWSGMGITSSSAAAEPQSRSVGYTENSTLTLGSYATFRGQSVDDTSLLIAYTRTGDANLDGLVNDDDVTIVSAMYAPGVSNPHWALGDFDYNGFVDDDDVTLLGVFYDPKAAPLAAPEVASIGSVTPVPEPASWLMFTLGSIAAAVLGCRRCEVRRTGKK